MIRQDQVCESARIVDEAPEAGDKGDPFQALAHAPGLRRGKYRIRAVEKQDARARQLLEGAAAGCWSRACLSAHLRHEVHAALDTDIAGERIERIDRKSGEQSVRVRERHAADDGRGRAAVDELASQTIESPRGNAGDLLDSIWGALTETAGP